VVNEADTPHTDLLRAAVSHWNWDGSTIVLLEAETAVGQPVE
jgi:hypothetical protein